MSDDLTCENCGCVIGNEDGWTEKHQSYLDKVDDIFRGVVLKCEECELNSDEDIKNENFFGNKVIINQTTMSDDLYCENCECVIGNEDGWTEKHQSYLDKVGSECIDDEVWGCCEECASKIAKELIDKGEDEKIWKKYVIEESK